MHNKGLTLIEVIVVMAIIVIITVAIGFDLTVWNRNYAVERQMKELYSDLTNARMSAMQRNRMYFVSLTSGQYTVYEDTNPAPDGNGTLEVADRQVLQTQLGTRYPITWDPITISGSRINFTTRGISNVDVTKTGAICSNIDSNADINCIQISASRIKMGQLKTTIPNGGACVATTDPTTTNCVAK